MIVRLIMLDIKPYFKRDAIPAKLNTPKSKLFTEVKKYIRPERFID